MADRPIAGEVPPDGGDKPRTGHVISGTGRGPIVAPHSFGRDWGDNAEAGAKSNGANVIRPLEPIK